MKAVFAVTDACAGCGACLKTCPEKAIRPAPRDYGAPLLVLEDRCSGCAECAEVCPVSACIEVLLETECQEESAFKDPGTPESDVPSVFPTPHSLLPTPFQRTSLSLPQDPA